MAESALIYVQLLVRWNVDIGCYELYGAPRSWDVSTFQEDLNEKINCAGCGHEMTYGESYPSLEIHSAPFSWGYAVCPICHEAEVQRQIRKERQDLEEEKGA